MTNDPEPKHTAVYVGDPGDRDCGLGASEALDVIQALERNGIPSCITGAKSLVYYGAGRVAQDWEIAVPDDSFETAKTLFESNPKYKMLQPAMPQPKSLIHTCPLFKLKGVAFTLVLVPASEPYVDCSPAKCERSHSGIPYPKLEHLAQSLLDTQHYADLEDLVDGMDLDEKWGEENLRLERVPIEYIQRRNELICRALPGLPGLMASLSTAPDARRAWTRAVQGKRARMVPKYPEERYSTRFRLIGSPDPRLDTKRQV
ncbi:hypothetical protein C8A00DRAFT_15713 [Chaetomidium leptoderma]|uniref:Uncharacterized protein n=1 Tax=Chaetomidium leptoderma TaxID=669021 RepID=A0AAN6ZW37_9PEZI|nr:hypothetical protein C8A00DRAFT_15713 [Chaetomidium leptoderma]